VTNDIKVDVIIPNYNETLLLSRAVESVLIQGGAVNKIIIVDDGSDEETLRYLNSNFSSIDKIQIVYSARRNHPGMMRDIGINQSNSDWIAFLDADDFWEPNKLRKQISFALEGNFEVVCSDANLFQNFVKVGQIYQFDVAPKIKTKRLLKENIIINSSSLIKRDCFQKIGGYPKEYYLRGVEDYSAWLRLSVHFRIGFLNETLVNYEDQVNSLGKQQNPILRNIAIFDFIFWSKRRASLYVHIYSKYYLLRVLGRA
jgi:glycosyltransferase involved in cell wall biosynthesis